MDEHATHFLAARLVAEGGAPKPRLQVCAGVGAPAEDEVVLAMRLAPINPADLLVIDGGYAFAPEPPKTLGAEGVGEVVAAGARSGFQSGQLVLPLDRGVWAGRLRLRADRVLPCPPGLTLEQAASLRINPATAARLLRLADLKPGDAVIQHAGGSSVGRYVAALAARRGVRCLSVVRRPPPIAAHEGETWLTDGDDLVRRVAAAAAGAPVRLALDPVAGEASGRLAACLASADVLGVYGHLSGEPCRIPSALLTGRGLTVKGFSLRPSEAAEPREDLVRFYQDLAGTLAGLPVEVATTYPLAELERALAHARDPARRGKVMLDLRA